MSGRGKARLPSTGIRKPRAKDKRVGRKRNKSNDNIPRDEMDATLMRAAWRDYDVHKVGGHFEWVHGVVLRRFRLRTTPCSRSCGTRASGATRMRWRTPSSRPCSTIRWRSDYRKNLTMNSSGSTPATKFGELSRQVTVAVDHLRSQAVVARARAEIDAVPEYQLDDTEPQP